MTDPSLHLSHRPVEEKDIPQICRFPQDEQDLFFMFPKAEYPLTVEQLERAIAQRFDSTVVLREQDVVGFANFYHCEPEVSCSIGNVIIRPDVRGKGVGRYLITAMIGIAVSKYRVTTVKLSCFNQNINGLLLYHRVGFKPVSLEERLDWQGRPVFSIHLEFSINPEPG